MPFAESISIDPGLIVLILVVFAAFVLATVALVVVGVVSGYRSGRDPWRRRALIAWVVSTALQATALVLVLLADGGVGWVPIIGVTLATTIGARLVGRRAR